MGKDAERGRYLPAPAICTAARQPSRSGCLVPACLLGSVQHLIGLDYEVFVGFVIFTGRVPVGKTKW
jgi:hypothetical protein